MRRKFSSYDGLEHSGPARCFMLNTLADHRGYITTALGEPAARAIHIEAHILLQTVWNALTARDRSGQCAATVVS